MIKAQCIGFFNTPPLWEKRQFDVQQFEFPSLAIHRFQPKPIPRNIRLEWVMEPNDQVAWKSHTEIMIEIDLRLQQEKTPMVWLKKSDTAFEKLFVVWW